MEWLIPLLVSAVAVASLKLLELIIANSPTFTKRRVTVEDRFMDSLRDRAIDAELERDQEKIRADRLAKENLDLRVLVATLEATTERLRLEIEQLTWRIDDLEKSSGFHEE